MITALSLLTIFDVGKKKLPEKVNLIEMESDDAWVRDTGSSVEECLLNRYIL